MQALSVGIFPYVLKLLQSSARELRPLLVFIWAKILAVDSVSGLKPPNRKCPSQNPPLRDDPKHVGHNSGIFRKGAQKLRVPSALLSIHEIHDVIPLGPAPRTWDGPAKAPLGHVQVSLSLLSGSSVSTVLSS